MSSSSFGPRKRSFNVNPRRIHLDTETINDTADEPSVSQPSGPRAKRMTHRVPGDAPLYQIRRAPPEETEPPLDNKEYVKSSLTGHGNAYLPMRQRRIVYRRVAPSTASVVSPSEGRPPRVLTEYQEYQEYSDEEVADPLTSLGGFLRQPEVEVTDVASCLCDTNSRSAGDVIELLTSLKGNLGMIRLQGLFTRARATANDRMEYTRLLELGMAIKMNEMHQEVAALREELVEVKRELARYRKSSAAIIFRNMAFVKARVVGNFVLPPENGLPGGDLCDILHQFVVPHAGNAENGISMAKRCSRFFIHKLVPEELKNKFTIRTRRGRKSDGLLDFPTSYRIAVREVVLQCLGVNNVSDSNGPYSVESISQLEEEIERTMQDTLNDLRRKKGRENARANVEDNSGRSPSPESPQGFPPSSGIISIE